MTVTVPTIEPDCIIAGDTVTWKRSLSCYPADDGWTLTYHIQGAEAIGDIVAAASGADHLVTIAAAVTADYDAGNYWWQAKVSKAGAVYTVDKGTLEIFGTLDGVVGAYDGRSHYKTVLDALEAMLEGKASKDQLSYSIAGRSISRMSPAEILDWINEYRSRYRIEQKKEAQRRGTGKGSNKVLVRFT